MPAMEGGWQLFQQCGWPSWFSLLLGLVAFALSIVALAVALFRARARRFIAWLALIVALLPLGVGALGMQLGRAKLERAISGGMIDPSQRERIRDLGYQEAESCVAVGGAFSAAPLLFALIAVVLGYALPRKDVITTGGAG